MSFVQLKLNLGDVTSLIHAVAETSVCERPPASTTQKLASALRRLDRDRSQEQTWQEVESIKG